MQTVSVYHVPFLQQGDASLPSLRSEKTWQDCKYSSNGQQSIWGISLGFAVPSPLQSADESNLSTTALPTPEEGPTASASTCLWLSHHSGNFMPSGP